MDPMVAVAVGSWAQRHWRAIAGSVLVLALAAAAMLALIAGAAAGMFSSQTQQQMTAQTCPVQPGMQAPFSQWGSTQMANAATIVAVGQARKIPSCGEVIAVAAAMQEQACRTCRAGRQTRPAGPRRAHPRGWGTHAQITDPVFASRQFYIHLLEVPGWQRKPLTVAAQAVERSRHPRAYAKWQAQAQAVVSHLAGPSALAAEQCAEASAPAPTRPVATIIAYAWRQLGKPYLWGGAGPGAFDCSGLVMMAYQAAGINIPRTSEAQWAWGPRVAPGHEEPGDLVFFPGSDGTVTSPGHVGLVVARGMMIEPFATGFSIRQTTYTNRAPVGFTRPWAHSGLFLILGSHHRWPFLK